MKPWLRAGLCATAVACVCVAAGGSEQIPWSGDAIAGEKPTPEPERRPMTVQDFSQIFSEVAEETLPSVVTILASRTMQPQAVPDSPYVESVPFEGYSDDPEQDSSHPGQETYQRALGTGVIVREDGYILTNHHVIDKADEIKIRLHDHREVDAKVLGTDPKSDLAVVKIDAHGLRAGRLGDSDALRIGEWVLCVGSPLSETLEYSVTAGIVSAKGRSNVGLADYEDYIQTDAAINPGNSGGPMLNLKGEIVGINTAIASQTGGYQGVGFAVPSMMARNIMEQLIAKGRVTRGWLGVMIQNLDEMLVEALSLASTDGVLVGDIIEQSPASQAGLQIGDVITSMDGQRVVDVTALRNKVAGFAPGRKVQLEILRNGKKQSLAVEIVELVDEQPPAKEEGSSFEPLGVRLEVLTESLAARHDLPFPAQGVVVSSVEEGRVAWNAGLRDGDLIRSANKQTVASVEVFQQILAKLQPGTPVLLFLERSDGTLFIAFKMPH